LLRANAEGEVADRVQTINPASRKGGIRKYPLHRSPPAAPFSGANSSADPKRRVQRAEPGSGRRQKRRQAGTSVGCEAAAGVMGLRGQHGPAPRAVRAPGGPEVLLLQWLWQLPTWQAAARARCTRSLCIVRAREQEEGPREKKEEEIIRIDQKNKAISPETAAGI